MNTRTVVTVIAVALMSAGVVPMSLAQGNADKTRDGIEVITIIGKRPSPTLATVCASRVTAPSDIGAAHQGGDDEASKVSERFAAESRQRVDKHCIEQTAPVSAAQI
jgi:hypothetical protein